MSSQSSPSITSAPPTGPSRRALIGGAAWSVPIIALATSAPSASASLPIGVIGTFQESSPQIASQAISMSALYIDCEGGTSAGWAGHVFRTTLVVEYHGSNPGFSFAGWTNHTTAWTMTSTATTMTLTIDYAFGGCGTGAGQLPGVYVTGNPFQVDPGAGTITVTGTAVDLTPGASFRVENLTDAADQPIVGPR